MIRLAGSADIHQSDRQQDKFNRHDWLTMQKIKQLSDLAKPTSERLLNAGKCSLQAAGKPIQKILRQVIGTRLCNLDDS